MKSPQNSAAALIERIRQRAPEFLDLITAETEAEFEAAFLSVLDSAVRHLERNRLNYKDLTEVGLSGVLAAALTIPGLVVTQEAHSNGHVDLTIEARHCVPARTKLGEAKIYDGPAYHIGGVDQLLSRYTTGREGTGLLITYVRQNDIKGIIAKIKLAMDQQLPQNQTEPCGDHALKWSLTTKHKHQSGELVAVDHIGCNLSF